MGGQHGEVLGGIGIALLALVARHEDRIKVFRARMRQFVQHPRLAPAGLGIGPEPQARLASHTPAEGPHTRRPASDLR
jgi:hypothetical protein